MLIALSHFIDEAQLLLTLGRYLDMVVPGQSAAFMEEVAAFLAHRTVIGGVLIATLIFFSSLAFTVLENAMSVIFHHRVAIRRRHFLVSALIPYCYIMVLGIGLLLMTVMAGALQAFGAESVAVFGRTWSLGGVSGLLLYLLGVGGEVLVLTSIYLVMPVGRLSPRHALIGGATAALLWEIMRHLLVWYFATLSAGQAGVRVAGDVDRRAAEPRNRRDGPAARCAGDRRGRAHPAKPPPRRAARAAYGFPIVAWSRRPSVSTRS